MRLHVPCPYSSSLECLTALFLFYDLHRDERISLTKVGADKGSEAIGPHNVHDNNFHILVHSHILPIQRNRVKKETTHTIILVTILNHKNSDMGEGESMMKKRIVKKWIKRYVEPMLAGIEETDRYDNQYNLVCVVNGEIVPEGNMYPSKPNAQISLKNHIEGIKRILQSHKIKRVQGRQKTVPIIADNQRWQYRPEHWRKHPKMKLYGIQTFLMIKKPLARWETVAVGGIELTDV